MFRLEARILSKKGSQGGTRSMAGALAYRLGVQLESDDGVHDYSRRPAVSWAPVGEAGEGDWTRDPSRFAAVVDATEKRKDAQLGREIILTLDRRIPPSLHAPLAEEWARRALPPRVAGFYAVHAPKALDGCPNHHIHLVYSNRAVEGGGLGKKIRQTTAENAEELTTWRAAWAQLQNRELERLGHLPDLDHRRRPRESSEPPPEPKLGAALYAARSKGPATVGPAAARVRAVLDIRAARHTWLRSDESWANGASVGYDANRRSAATKRLLAGIQREPRRAQNAMSGARSAHDR